MHTFWGYLREEPLLMIIIVLWFSYKLVAGIRRYQVSGFRLYLVGHILWILVFFVLIWLIFLIKLEVLDLPAPLVVLFGLVLASMPQALLEARFQKGSPALWKDWVDKARQARQSN